MCRPMTDRTACGRGSCRWRLVTASPDPMRARRPRASYRRAISHHAPRPCVADQRYRDGWFTTVDGLRLHFRDYPGSAERAPLLCLHGLTRNARDFAAFGERHSPRFRVIALDFRGRGESDRDPLPARYTPLTYAADVQQLLDHLGLAQAVFVGTSLGGLVTMSLALLGPQRIAAAILNDVGPELGQAGLDRIQGYVGKGERFASWDEAADAIAVQQGSAFPGYERADWLAMARRNCR